MVAVDEVDHPLGVTPQEAPSRRKPLTLAVVIVLGLVGFAWVAGWVRQTPEVLHDGEATTFPAGPERGPFHVTVIEPATSGRVADVPLVGIDAVVARNSADAVIGFVVCTPRAERPPLVSDTRSLDESCARTRAAEDTTLRAAGEYVVMTIAPERAGTVRVTGIEVTYRQGWQLLWLPQTLELSHGVRVKVT